MLESVRKFGPQHSDLPTMISNISTMFRVLSLNIDARNKTPIPISIRILTLIISLTYLYVYVCCGLWFTFCRCPQTGDWLTAMATFSLAVTSVIGYIKLLFMWIFAGTVQQMVHKYIVCDSLVVAGSRFAHNLNYSLRDVKKRAIFYWLLLVNNGFLYAFKPVITPGKHFNVEAFVIYGLEPMFESPNYEISTALMTVIVIYICYVVANVTSFLIVIIGYTECQMLALSEELLSLWDDAMDHYETLKNVNKLRCQLNKEKIVNAYINDHLIDIAERHVVNMTMLQEIENATRHPTAIGFLFLVTGLIAELLGGLENTYMQMPYTMNQFATECYIGQKLMDASVSFELAIYACKWERFNTNNRKIVLTMLANSQKSLTLTAGGMAILCFTFLMSLFKMSFSTYTTLRSSI